VQKNKCLLLHIPLARDTECSKVSNRSYVFTLEPDSYLLTFPNDLGNVFFILHIYYISIYDDSNSNYFFKF
jgi:hypothetical protein